MTKSFKDLNLSPTLLDALSQKGFEFPTEIQEKVILTFVEHERDIYVQSQTGTGKTGAYGIPILNHISSDKHDVGVLVLSPTRELTLQVSKELADFSKQTTVDICQYWVEAYGSSIKTTKKEACCCGWVSRANY